MSGFLATLRAKETYLSRAVEALERIADADDRRNELLVADAAERRESWARAEERQERALAAIRIHPADWLADSEHDRLYWAIARARGRPSGSTVEDEALARAIIAELREMPT